MGHVSLPKIGDGRGAGSLRVGDLGGCERGNTGAGTVTALFTAHGRDRSTRALGN